MALFFIGGGRTQLIWLFHDHWLFFKDYIITTDKCPFRKCFLIIKNLNKVWLKWKLCLKVSSSRLAVQVEICLCLTVPPHVDVMMLYYTVLLVDIAVPNMQQKVKRWYRQIYWLNPSILKWKILMYYICLRSLTLVSINN